jgi:uncharacterized SAM-binding protein YcdF (DUF218 family)
MTYLQPVFAIVLLLTLAELIRSWRSERLQRPWYLALALGLVFLVSWQPVAWLALRPFEGRYPLRAYPVGDAEAIVVLASAVYASYPPMPEPTLGGDTFGRCQYAAWLHRNWRPLPILACGGAATGDVPYSLTMAKQLQRDGVPEAAIWREERSRSTHENAVNGAALLRQKGIRRIVLVTDAYHMLRAEKCFRKEGLQVVAAPCGYRTEEGFHFDRLAPGWQPIEWNEDTAHESLGLLWYWIRGWV